MKGPTLTQAKNREDESTMISKTCCIARMIVLASFALSSAAWAATCSNASLSGTYGFLHGGTDRAGQVVRACCSNCAYWYMLYPVHRWIFGGMLKEIAAVAGRRTSTSSLGA
jgi:hypothetical protein